MKTTSANGYLSRRTEIILFVIAATATLFAAYVLFSNGLPDRLRGAPIPADTPPTTAGTVLGEGETWVGDGLALTAGDFCVVDCDGHIQVTFRVYNLTENQIVLDLLPEDAFILLDNGERLVAPLADETADNELRMLSLQGGKSYEWTWMFTYRDPATGVPAPLPIGTTAFELNVTRVGERLQAARWAGEIPR